jgi:hypothetical protein
MGIAAATVHDVHMTRRAAMHVIDVLVAVGGIDAVMNVYVPIAGM